MSPPDARGGELSPPDARGAAEAGWALALVCALLAVQAPRDGGALAPCAEPREVAAAAGHSLRVDCSGQGAPLRGPARLLFGQGLDPNRADARALEAVPGVGPARAAAIVAARAQGPYRTLEDLGRVRGIGPVTLRRSAAWWSFEPDPAPLSSSR